MGNRMNHKNECKSIKKIKKTGIRIFFVLLDLLMFPFWLLAECVQILCALVREHRQISGMWKAWFRAYVPQHIHEESVLGILSLMAAIDGLPKEEIRQHLEENRRVWHRESADYGKSRLPGVRGGYIEYQAKMGDIRYGTNLPALDRLLFGAKAKLDGSRNTCEVIALYNVLVYLHGGNPPQDFPSLLAQFEQKGILLGGYFGTSPDHIQAYLQRNYRTRMLTGRQLISDTLQELSADYDVYIMTAYNNRTDITGQIHTVCITRETEGYQVHNGDRFRVYDTLAYAVEGYHDGEGRAICVIGAAL